MYLRFKVGDQRLEGGEKLGQMTDQGGMSDALYTARKEDQFHNCTKNGFA